MPRGDGTGPSGGGGCGRGGGRGMGFGAGRGRGRARRMGVGEAAANRSAVPGNTPLIEPQRVRASMQRTSALQPPVAGEARAPARRADRRQRVARIDETACNLCAACQSVCPTGAISLGETGAIVNAEMCRGCGVCATVCPNGAIKLN